MLLLEKLHSGNDLKVALAVAVTVTVTVTFLIKWSCVAHIFFGPGPPQNV